MAPGPFSGSAALRSPTLRALALSLLVLFLQIPVLLVGSIAREREGLRDNVLREIGEQWGGAQVVTGPWLEIPYAYTVEKDGEANLQWETLRVLPHELATDAQATSSVRTRGIFGVPVYTARVSLNGSFEVPAILDATEVAWDRARLVLGISDPSAIHDTLPLVWNDVPKPFEPGRESGSIELPVALGHAGTTHTFATALELAGTHGLFVSPAGEQSTLQMSSDWPHPSFQGSWLPDEREVGPAGFSARWTISNLARGFPTEWRGSSDDMRQRLALAAVGAELKTSVDPYVMSARSTRYAILFFAAVLGVLWVLEVRGEFRLHPLHYLLTSAALCTFHLLILAFAEHLGFPVAYMLASGMVTLLIVYYARIALARSSGAAVVGATCLAIYGYLYVCLANEDHALLFGALGVFAGVAALMILTRRMATATPVLDEVA